MRWFVRFFQCDCESTNSRFTQLAPGDKRINLNFPLNPKQKSDTFYWQTAIRFHQLLAGLVLPPNQKLFQSVTDCVTQSIPHLETNPNSTFNPESKQPFQHALNSASYRTVHSSNAIFHFTWIREESEVCLDIWWSVSFLWKQAPTFSWLTNVRNWLFP